MHIPRTKVALTGFAVAAVAAIPLGSTLASAAPAGGVFHFSAVSTNINAANPPDTTVITGAIGDHGTSTSSQNGTGPIVTTKLSKGSLKINIAALNAKTNSETFGTFDAQTCTFFGTATATVKLTGGTGAYKGAHGSATATEWVAVVGPRLASGACNPSGNAPAVAGNFSVEATGIVHF
jgi:hypothetical protein